MISLKSYYTLVSSGKDFAFTCSKCTLLDLPYIDNPTDTPQSPSTTNDIAHGRNITSKLDLSCFHRKGLHFLGLNVRSLLPKLSELRILAAKAKPATLSLSETWLDETVTDSEVAIPGYSIIRKDQNRHGRGVCLYIRNDLSFNIRNDLQTMSIESVWIDILLPKTRPILVGSVYRPPNQQDFLDEFEQQLKRIDIDQECYILGDFNICTKNNRCSTSLITR